MAIEDSSDSEQERFLTLLQSPKTCEMKYVAIISVLIQVAGRSLLEDGVSEEEEGSEDSVFGGDSLFGTFEISHDEYSNQDTATRSKSNMILIQDLVDATTGAGIYYIF